MYELIIELIWTLVALVGSYWGLLNMRDARRELEALHVLGRRGAPTAFARGTFIQEAVRMAGYAVALTIGMAALFNVLPSAIAVWSLVVFLVAFTINSGITRWVLKQINKALDDMEDGKEVK